jgi:hypothetical protein
VNRNFNAIRGFGVADRMVAGFSNRQLLHRYRETPAGTATPMMAVLLAVNGQFDVNEEPVRWMLPRV